MFLPSTIQERILNNEQGQEKRLTGWQAGDLHVHSTCSPDVLPSPEFHPEAIYQKALQRGMSYITITDHDTMDAYDIIGWDRENLVTGTEIAILDPVRVGHTLHINVYDLDKQQFQELIKIAQIDRNLETFLTYLKDQDLPFTYNHPFWFAQSEKPNYEAVREIAPLFPVIEYNYKRVRKRNYMALWLAVENKKGVVANTDTHIGEVGEIYTLSKGETFREYFQTIKNGDFYLVPNDMNLTNLTQEIITWIETIFEMESTTNHKKDLQLTRIQSIDGLINFIIQKTESDYPYTFPFIKSFLRTLVKTNLISYIFIRSQTSKANHIGKLLEIPDLA
jgi:predicted metal-dependent phosphoesterase TrpH